MDSVLLTPKETAKYLNVCLSDLAQSRATGRLGKIPSPLYVRIGNRVRYRKTELDQWVDSLQGFQNMAEED